MTGMVLHPVPQEEVVVVPGATVVLEEQEVVVVVVLELAILDMMVSCMLRARERR
jgi:hypothetical protein